MNLNQNAPDTDAMKAIPNDVGTEEVGSEETVYLGETKKKMSRNGMTFLGIVLAAGGAIAFMTLKGGPQSANAAMQAPAAKTANTTITTFLSGGSTNIQAMQQMLRNTEKVVKQFMAYPSTTQIPLGDLKTNPFRHAAARQAEADAEVMKKRREVERGAALKAVQSLQLQSILFSDARRACMINGQMLKEGQQIDTFTVDKISTASVIVRTGAYRFELKMQP